MSSPVFKYSEEYDDHGDINNPLCEPFELEEKAKWDCKRQRMKNIQRPLEEKKIMIGSDNAFKTEIEMIVAQ